MEASLVVHNDSAEACLETLAASDPRRRRAELTFRGNVQQGRHGWLRLTPAYSLHVVNEILGKLTPTDLVLDPFSGTATTTLASTVRGIPAHSLDINPFLVWFGNLKITRFDADVPDQLIRLGCRVVDWLRQRARAGPRWAPDLYRIERWWDRETLDALSELFVLIRDLDCREPLKDLLKVAFCRVMISSSNASFGHQSMSFKKPRPAGAGRGVPWDQQSKRNARGRILDAFAAAVEGVAAGAGLDVPAAGGRVVLGDARHLDRALQGSLYSAVITSPPYPNRMSYIRELRPYMYWLGFLESGRQAGELDWDAIGGTWGCATSNLTRWQPASGTADLGRFEGLVAAIAARHELLGKYVRRYFDDVRQHLGSLRRVLQPGARCFYVVGNSKFYDTLLPVEEIYAALLEDAGFTGVGWQVIRKRNSKKELFEFVVYATNPSPAAGNR